MDLHLVLKHKWYDMIADGVKPEEYRKIGDFWESRLWRRREKFKRVVFHRGYTNTTMTKTITQIVCTTGRPEWGAEQGTMYYVIRFE